MLYIPLGLCPPSITTPHHYCCFLLRPLTRAPSRGPPAPPPGRRALSLLDGYSALPLPDPEPMALPDPSALLEEPRLLAPERGVGSFPPVELACAPALEPWYVLGRHAEGHQGPRPEGPAQVRRSLAPAIWPCVAMAPCPHFP